MNPSEFEKQKPIRIADVLDREGEEEGRVGGGLSSSLAQLGRRRNSFPGEEVHSERVQREVTVRSLEEEAGGRIGVELRREFWAGGRRVEAMSRAEVVAASGGDEFDQEEEPDGSLPRLCIRTSWGNLKKPDNLGHATQLGS